MYVNYIDWHINPFRAERWLEVWRPALDRALSSGARSCTLTRNIDDPLHFRQVSVWENKDDFERYWFSDQLAALRERALNLYNKPVAPAWHSLLEARPDEGAGGAVEVEGDEASAEEPSEAPAEQPA